MVHACADGSSTKSMENPGSCISVFAGSAARRLARPLRRTSLSTPIDSESLQAKKASRRSNQAQRNSVISVRPAPRRFTATVKRRSMLSRFAVARYGRIQVCASPTMASLLRRRLGSTSATTSGSFPIGPIQRWLGSSSRKAMAPNPALHRTAQKGAASELER